MSTKSQADEIFELVNKFAGYGFNKSHAAAYAFISYQTGWLKANHPVEFFAANMSARYYQHGQAGRVLSGCTAL